MADRQEWWQDRMSALVPFILEQNTLYSRKPPSKSQLPQYIDHTLLTENVDAETVFDFCADAMKYNFKTVCIRKQWIPTAVERFKYTPTAVCCVIGFPDPLSSSLQTKLDEVKEAMALGAQEFDIVINWPELKRDKPDYEKIYREIAAIRGQLTSKTCKVILETSQLTNEQVVAASIIAYEAKYDFIKTSTGFCGGGAKLDHVRLMAKVCNILSDWDVKHKERVRRERPGYRMRVKASGGIKSASDALKMIENGASRLGCSASLKIMEEMVDSD